MGCGTAAPRDRPTGAGEECRAGACDRRKSFRAPADKKALRIRLHPCGAGTWCCRGRCSFLVPNKKGTKEIGTGEALY